MASKSPAKASRPRAKPGAVAAQAKIAYDELSTLTYLRERSVLKQAQFGADDGDSYSAWRDGGEVLSFADYREQLDAAEARLRGAVSPAALRLAEKRLRADDSVR